MSDALPLPPRPNIEQYKKLAKDFQQACKSGEPALRHWVERWMEALNELHSSEVTSHSREQMAGDIARIERTWRNFRKANPRSEQCALSDAQFFVARCHGFSSWPKFTRHVSALTRADSQVSKFEEAVDAIVDGNLAALERLLAEEPGLVRARSTREHRSTLLHYVSANGVEDFRQKTPKNIVAIAKLLLDAGADVNAGSEAYGGRSTTLGLTATSSHPHHAGVQLPLMELLINRGAVIDYPDGSSAVNGCLHNGRKEAEFLASRGARLDLEGAAGVGRLDVVESFFDQGGNLKPPATPAQMTDGFAWACEFGRTNVVDFLLRNGMSVDAKLRHDGQTGLHWAACCGNAEMVRFLLDRGASIGALDESYGGTPLGWALYGWGGSAAAQSESYYEVVALLVRAGARLSPPWYEGGCRTRTRHRAAAVRCAHAGCAAR